MNIDPNAKALKLAQQLSDAAIAAPDLEADGGTDARQGEEPGPATFTMPEFVERPAPPGHRGPGGRTPLGQWVTTVTVRAEWHPFEE